MIYISKSTEESEKIGYMLGEKLNTLAMSRAFIALRGEMGVGKTAFTRGFASYFGMGGVKSPTYSIVNEHRGAQHNIYHFDMYRIESDDDLYSIGYDDYLEKDGYMLVEWSENIEDFIPTDAIFVTISRTDTENERKIEITGIKDEDTCL